MGIGYDYFCHDPQAVYVGDLHLWYDCETIDYIPDETMPTGRRRVTFLILWRNNNYPSTLVPTKVIIDGTEEVFLDTTYSYTLNGQSITLYRFNIVQSDAIQATIDEIRESNLTQLPFIGSLHQIEVVCGGEVVQSFVVPVLNQDSL